MSVLYHIIKILPNYFAHFFDKNFKKTDYFLLFFNNLQSMIFLGNKIVCEYKFVATSKKFNIKTRYLLAVRFIEFGLFRVITLSFLLNFFWWFCDDWIIGSSTYSSTRITSTPILQTQSNGINSSLLPLNILQKPWFGCGTTKPKVHAWTTSKTMSVIWPKQTPSTVFMTCLAFSSWKDASIL